MRMPRLFATAPENLNIFDPAGPAAASIRDLFWLVISISIVIAFVVEGVLIYSVVKFRRRHKPGDTEPPQVYGSTPIEIAWTVAPAIVVVLLSLLLIRTELEVRAEQPAPAKNDNALYVTVVGHQWWWEYRYEYYNGEKLEFTTANELVIPAGDAVAARPVYFTLLSADTNHSFWLPRLAGKMDLIPNRVNQLSFQTKERGLFLGQCGDYCGTQHANMLLRADVLPANEFATWLANQRKEGAAPGDQGKAKKGREVFLGQSCINCHTVRGTRAAGTVGPDLTHLLSRKTLLTGLAPNDRDNLRRWVTDPQSMKLGALMPAFKLNETDTEALVEYLLSLR
jgi:cytochrome c oxidase subunit 2